MSGPRLSVALTRDVSPCKGCVRDVAKPQCHDWCWEHWKRKSGTKRPGKSTRQDATARNFEWRAA